MLAKNGCRPAILKSTQSTICAFCLGVLAKNGCRSDLQNLQLRISLRSVGKKRSASEKMLILSAFCWVFRLSSDAPVCVFCYCFTIPTASLEIYLHAKQGKNVRCTPILSYFPLKASSWCSSACMPKWNKLKSRRWVN